MFCSSEQEKDSLQRYGPGGRGPVRRITGSPARDLGVTVQLTVLFATRESSSIRRSVEGGFFFNSLTRTYRWLCRRPACVLPHSTVTLKDVNESPRLRRYSVRGQPISYPLIGEAL